MCVFKFGYYIQSEDLTSSHFLKFRFDNTYDYLRFNKINLINTYGKCYT